jgi:hypothetical protein
MIYTSLLNQKPTRRSLPFYFSMVFSGQRRTTGPSASESFHLHIVAHFSDKKQGFSQRSGKICIRLGMPLDNNSKRLRPNANSQDLRNHGESPHSTRHDYPAMAQDVAEFIEGHGLTDTTLIGHSM